MPATLNGKVLTAFLKNGQSLCAGYQLGRCRLEESACSGAHRCAAWPCGAAGPVEGTTRPRFVTTNGPCWPRVFKVVQDLYKLGEVSPRLVPLTLSVFKGFGFL